MSSSAEKTRFSASQVEAITRRVMDTVEKALPEEYYLIATDLEKEFGQWFLRVYVARRDRAARMALVDPP